MMSRVLFTGALILSTVFFAYLKILHRAMLPNASLQMPSNDRHEFTMYINRLSMLLQGFEGLALGATFIRANFSTLKYLVYLAAFVLVSNCCTFRLDLSFYLLASRSSAHNALRFSQQYQDRNLSNESDPSCASMQHA